MKSYRVAIEEQIALFRKTQRHKECCLCKSKKLLDVDHYPVSFNQLVRDYEATGILEDFSIYHKQNAKLRLLCRECHRLYGLKK